MVSWDVLGLSQGRLRVSWANSRNKPSSTQLTASKEPPYETHAPSLAITRHGRNKDCAEHLLVAFGMFLATYLVVEKISIECVEVDIAPNV